MSCLLSYNLVGITGDCTNQSLGSFEIEIFGDAPDFTIQWLSPITTTIPLGEGATIYNVENLSSGTYVFNIIDSCSPNNTTVPVSIYISSGTCCTISQVQSTLCNENNGSLTATTTYDYGESSFYLYHNTLGYVTSGVTNVNLPSNSTVFSNLSAGTYYVVVDDGGGCTGITQSVIIQPSDSLDFGFYVVNDAGCAVNSGKIFVTGLTGNPPYTYLWTNGETTDSISGLTTGGYGVTITDNSGCEISKDTYITQVPPMGESGILVTQPSCFTSNGSATIYISGGTSPFYYSGSNGTVIVDFNNIVVFDNLPAGTFNYYVQDAGLCKYYGSVNLTTPLSFNIVSVTKTNSSCNDNGGTINVQVSSGTPPYTFTLTYPDTSVNSTTTTFGNYTFNNLESGSYTLSITDAGECEYIETVVIENDILFNLDIQTTGTTCNLSNGAISIEVSGGTGPYLYEIDGAIYGSNETTLSAQTFSNIVSGSYLVSVTDTSVPCKQTFSILVQTSSNVDFITTSSNPTGSNNGSITTLITDGQPPFTLEWSSNVNGQTGMTVSNLSAGTYTIKITDDIGCVKQKSVVLQGTNTSSNYSVYNVCESTFQNTGVNLQKKALNMLLEGFNDLTVNEENCILNLAIFDALVTISGVTTSSSFYTGSTLSDVPTDEMWGNAIIELVSSYDGITDVFIDYNNNDVSVIAECSLSDVQVSVNMVIHYDISCSTCNDCPDCGNKRFQDSECFDFMDYTPYDFMD